MRLRILGAAVCALVLILSSAMPGVAESRSPAPTGAAPAAVGLSGVSAIAAGGNHTCAIMESGAVRCWGNNAYGQLGDSTMTNRALPVEVVGLGESVTAIAAGVYHTCALTASGGVKCWGWNQYGQLGNASTATSSVPVNVSGLSSGVVGIAAGWAHTCAVTAGGAVKCWGWNVLGELGDGTLANSTTPVNAVGLSGPVTTIELGADHTCARLATGSVVCWGFNESGQVGDNTTISRPTPVSVVGLASGAQSIALGALHTCARTPADGAVCWGANSYGQVGNSSTTSQLTPANVTGLSNGVLAVSAAGFHSCALLTGGALKCWGYNDAGQLGDATTSDRSAPVSVLGLGGPVTAVAAGDSHTCAITASGGVKCWGLNSSGQLGDGTNTGRTEPVDVLGLTESPTATPTRTPTRTQTPTRTPTPKAITPVSRVYLPVILWNRP